MRDSINFMFKHSSGRKITYKKIGDPSGIPFLYFHGWGSAASSIFFDKTFLDENHIFILMVNRPGYGGSGFLEDYTMYDHAEDVNEVLDYLGIERAHCFGWSNGALFSQVFASKYPRKVTSLSLAGSAIPLESKESREYLPARWKFIRRTFRLAPSFTRGYLKHINKIWTGRIERMLLGLLNRQNEDKNLEDLKGQLKKQTAEGLWEAYRTKGWSEYAELRAMMVPFNLPEENPPFPAYIWYGEKDKMWPKKTAVYLQEKYQGSQLKEIKQEGHFFFLICWRRIVENVLSNE
ncbi:alpha/beta hydrolase [Rossellomorea vietnamensis]|uniref:Alpha/beta hydrolase n=1 Tax=Rossellomorea vietnamensis TaxID=218284 RepID=A0A5D4K8Z0_9BACI|nr:alpha/beta hydrolase [Rossellomorea vietnamensis]TYR73329.1 alpha/beta hydrolase [Rossellomorea vietnamensis]